MRSERPQSSLLGELALLLGVLGLVLAGLALAGWRPATRLSLWSDLQSYSLPKYAYAAERLAAGEVPLWNPFEFSGIPFLATLQHGVFYPPVRLAYAVAAGETAWVLCFLLHVALGGVGGYLLGRAFGCGPLPAVLAAAWVVQPSWLARLWDYPAVVGGVTWAPWLILGLWRAISFPGGRAAAWLGLAAALELLGGYPPFALALAYLGALALVCFMVDVPGSSTPRQFGSVVATVTGAVVLALLLTAAQLFPTVELAALTNRGAEVARDRHLLRSAIEQSPALADLLGLPRLTFAEYVPFLWRDVGPLVLSLAALGLALGWRRGRTWWAAGALALCLLPLGAHDRLPLASLVRCGFEWICLLPVIVFLLAGLGLDQSLRATGVRRALIPAILALGVLAATTAWNWASVPRTWYTTHVAPSDPPHPALVRDCEDGPRFRTFWAAGQYVGAPMRYRMRSTGGYEQALIPARSAAVVAALGLGNGGLPGEWARRLGDRRPLASRLALRCVVGYAPMLNDEGFERLTPPFERVAVYRNRDARPRARLAYSARLAASPEEALRLLLDDPGEAVVLEGAPGLTTPCAVPATGEAEISEDHPERVVVNVRTSCPGWLVLADGFMPGWTARVNGAPGAIRIADVAFRAVTVPAGTHVVVFTYAPWTFRVGLVLSVLGLVVFGVLVLRHRPHSRESLRTMDTHRCA